MLGEDTDKTNLKEAAMEKYDIKKTHKALYAPSSKDFSIVDVPFMRYIAVDGHGDPNTSASYTEAIEALYSSAYTLKFASKNEQGRDFVVGPLEGLWSAKDMTSFTSRDKDAWDWTMMIAQPAWITPELVAEAVAKVAAKKKKLAGLALLRVLEITEGKSVQILHIGSYDDEAPTLARLHEHFLPENKLDYNGVHHEIYLSDPRRTEAAKLKTILRQPVRPL